MTNPVNGYRYTNYQNATYGAQSKKAEETAAEEKDAQQAAQPAEEAAKNQDTFVKSSDYKPDMDKVNAMKAELNNNVAAFKKMVQGLFKNQGSVHNKAMGDLLEIDSKTQLEAQQAISEDGEWGVENTAQRILDFAKALSGGDPAKIELLRDSVKQGFAAAEGVWGSTLPDISYKTLDRVMQGFDEWANEYKTDATQAEA